MSLCDSCREPGHCCKRLFLSRESSGPVTEWTPLHALARMAAEWLPFILQGERLAYQTPEGAHYSHFAMTCPLLTSDGRCGDYEHRPQLCRDFEPGSTPLCIEHVPDAQSASAQRDCGAETTV